MRSLTGRAGSMMSRKSIHQIGSGGVTERSGRASVIGSMYGKRVVDKFEDIQNHDLTFKERIGTLVMTLLAIFLIPAIMTLRTNIRNLEHPIIEFI